MLTYWWYRHIHRRQEFEKDAGVDAFAGYYLSANLKSIKGRGDRIREVIRELRARRLAWTEERKKLLEEGNLLRDAEFHNVSSKYQRYFLILTLIAISESGLNYFTAMIAIPEAGILAGLLGTVLRLIVAVTVTVFAIVSAEQLLDDVLPAKKYGGEHAEAGRSALRAPTGTTVLWGIILVGTEFMIYKFGWARANDIDAGHVNRETAQALISLSMIVPLVGGGLAWELSNIRDAYKNRLRFDELGRLIARADLNVEKLAEKENSFFQKETNDWWYTFSRVKSFKEYFNTRIGQKTLPLSAEHQYARDLGAFYAESLRLYNQHKERQDALGNLKIDVGSDVRAGTKLGQDNA